MINKRLISLVPESNKHIKMAVLIKIVALLCNVIIAFAMADFLQKLVIDKVAPQSMTILLVIIVATILVRYLLTQQFSKQSHLASTMVKKRLRRMIFEKILKLGNGYSENISTAEVIQASVVTA